MWGKQQIFSLSPSLIIYLWALSEPGQQPDRAAGFRNIPFPMETVNINTPWVERGKGMEEITKPEGRCKCTEVERPSAGKGSTGEVKEQTQHWTQHSFPCLRHACQGEEGQKSWEELP